MHTSSSSVSKVVQNQKRFFLLKLVFAAAAALLLISFIHLFSLHNQMKKTNNDNDDDDDDENENDDNNNNDDQKPSSDNNNKGLLSSILFFNKNKNNKGKNPTTESYADYSRKAFSSFPKGKDVPEMREHVLHLQLSPAPNKSTSTNNDKNIFADEKGNLLDENNNNNNMTEDEIKLKKRIRSLARLQEMARSISQKIVLDNGGRKVPNIVGNPVADIEKNNNNKKKKKNNNKMHDILNNNNNNNNNHLRVFSVQPTISGELEWIPEFGGSDKGNIVFKDKYGKDDLVNWFTAEVRHDGKPAFPTRFLLLQKLGLISDLFKFFQKQVAFERENNSNKQQQQQQKDSAGKSSLSSFYVDAEDYVANKNPSLQVQDSLEIARFKFASILGMQPKVLSHTFLVSSVANSAQQKNDENNNDGDGDNAKNNAEKEKQVPIDIATNLYDQIDLIVHSIQRSSVLGSKKKKKKQNKKPTTTTTTEETTFAAGSHQNSADEEKDDDDDDDKVNGNEDYEGQVVAVSVSSLYPNPEGNEAAVIYWRDKRMRNLDEDMLEDHSVKILTDFIVGSPESMKNNNIDNNVVGEDDGGVVIRNFMVVCAIAMTT